MKDYSSNIACLPGKYMNNPKGAQTRKISDKKFETHNIFKFDENIDINIMNNQLNSSHKRLKYKTAFNTTYEEKDAFRLKKSKRPKNMKNLFQSQITI